ncbi:hypothetical protein [Candidatus Lokiarchaeum ossiferum]|uniref:hypothetical protein n=1 Tax=Candidatus Lokiarchaeum ossiferum TaxID=2951803 RepID=UPI00352F1A49
MLATSIGSCSDKNTSSSLLKATIGEINNIIHTPKEGITKKNSSKNELNGEFGYLGDLMNYQVLIDAE